MTLSAVTPKELKKVREYIYSLEAMYTSATNDLHTATNDINLLRIKMENDALRINKMKVRYIGIGIGIGGPAGTVVTGAIIYGLYTLVKKLN